MRSLAARIATLHRALLWGVSVVLAVWVLSGFLHPLMSLLSPRPQRFQPPSLEVELSATRDGWAALRAAQGAARLIRLVPGPNGPLWQITDSYQRERRYLDLRGIPLSGGEAAYVRWLVSWYLGESTQIRSLALQTEFDAAYPWVNRLLPVWRVELAGGSPRTAFVHTETGSLTSLSDDRRQLLQTLFRSLHTLDWLDRVEPLRVLLIGLAMLSVLLLATTGLYLFWCRPGAPARRWHRRLGLVVALPVLLMSASGLLHALVFAGAAPARGLALPPVLPSLPASPGWFAVDGVQQSVALRALGDVVVLGHQATGAVTLQFLDAEATSVALSEAVQTTARAHLDGEAISLEPLPHFSPDYDFRNRRLPAWLAIEAGGDWVAIDPLTNQQLDRQDGLRRAEGWVFALLHKWQPLSMLLGSPQRRDVLQVVWLSLLLPLAWLGWRMRRPTRRTVTPSSSLENARP